LAEKPVKDFTSINRKKLEAKILVIFASFLYFKDIL